MIIIGEKINATRNSVKEFIQKRDEKRLVELAKRQVDAGADYIDVNVGTGTGSREDEIESMRWAVETIQAEIDKPLCIDSADPAVLEEGLLACLAKPCLINSAKAENKCLEEIVPLAAKHNSYLVALAMGETGIPKDVKGRICACNKIALACEKQGVPLENLFFDPLVLPISSDTNQGLCTLDTLKEIKKVFSTSKTTMGLSNISYGLPERSMLNEAFLHMAVYAGLDSVIMDPINEKMMTAVRRAETLIGRDRHCRKYMRAFRKK